MTDFFLGLIALSGFCNAIAMFFLSGSIDRATTKIAEECCGDEE